METKKIVSNTINISLSLALGGAILYWMYRGFDFQRVEHVLLHEMRWEWMLLSFPFGILAQMFRGWRWKQTLAPLNEHPRTSTNLNAIFISYAASLIIPRIGEFARCGIVKRYDNVSFTKALGTVVTERIIDSLLVAIIAALTFLFQFRIFSTFFDKTGTNLLGILSSFTPMGYAVTVICGFAIIILLLFLIRKLSVYHRVKDTLSNIWQGITSLKNVENKTLFIFFTLGIWGSYFLHYYLTFFCFNATEHLGIGCAMVTFVVGSMAVIVPTPNGAGPWHFAVKTMLILYGVSTNAALFFVLIVHAIQTMLVIALGIYAWAALALTKKKQSI